MIETGLVSKPSLNAEELARVRELERICNAADGIRLKLNLGMAAEGTATHNREFCYYQEGRLVGYTPLDTFGEKFEFTAAVLPDCRRQGVFRTLYEAARAEARRSGAKELLLVSYRSSEAGRAVVERLGLAYHSSEYRMEAEEIPPFTGAEIEITPVTPDDIPDLARLLAISFGSGDWASPERLKKELAQGDRHYFLARLNGEPIGQIGVILEENRAYVCGVGIAPEWRRRGYGRQLLALTVHRMLAAGHRRFALDVETKNEAALQIYKSCGFQETTIYDYYTTPL